MDGQVQVDQRRRVGEWRRRESGGSPQGDGSIAVDLCLKVCKLDVSSLPSSTSCLSRQCTVHTHLHTYTHTHIHICIPIVNQSSWPNLKSRSLFFARDGPTVDAVVDRPILSSGAFLVRCERCPSVCLTRQCVVIECCLNTRQWTELERGGS